MLQPSSNSRPITAVCRNHINLSRSAVFSGSSVMNSMMFLAIRAFFGRTSPCVVKNCFCSSLGRCAFSRSFIGNVWGSYRISGPTLSPVRWFSDADITCLFNFAKVSWIYRYQNRTYALHAFLSFPRRRESSNKDFLKAPDSRSPPSRGQASRE